MSFSSMCSMSLNMSLSRWLLVTEVFGRISVPALSRDWQPGPSLSTATPVFFVRPLGMSPGGQTAMQPKTGGSRRGKWLWVGTAAVLWSMARGTAGTTRLGAPDTTTTTSVPPPPPPESLTQQWPRGTTWIHREGRWMPRLPEGEIEDDVWEGPPPTESEADAANGASSSSR